MHRLTAYLTTTLLFAHTLLGCCSHHAHGSIGPASAPFCQVQHQDDNGAKCDHSHKGDPICEGNKCVFVRPVRVQPGDFVAWSQFAWVLTSLGDLGAAMGTSPASLPLSPHGQMLPVRLHLANQVLLI